ncbi:MAG: preprotein translocase subunit SecG [Alphaproteobacteria bacterium]|nr:preprotein translocase subunit SecG [Alphaproteobacteria bacterium]
MEHVVLIIHLILALGIIGLVLLQRSEGGGLGIGGGSGGLGAFASAGTTANVLTRATKYCAIAFFCTSLILAVLAGTHSSAPSLLESIDNPPAAVDMNAETGDNKLPEAQATGSDSQDKSSTPSAPLSE